MSKAKSTYIDHGSLARDKRGSGVRLRIVGSHTRMVSAQVSDSVIPSDLHTLTDVEVVRHRVDHGLRSSHASSVAPILARLPMIIADVIVILVTWKTQYNAYNMGKGLPTPMRLTAIVLRDGEGVDNASRR